MSTELVSPAAGIPQPDHPVAQRESGLSLSRRQKAAIVVRLLIASGENLPLSSLPADAQAELAHQLANLKYVDHHTLCQVVRDFLVEFDATGLSFPGGLDKALGLLEGTINSEVALHIRRQAGLALYADPWKRIGDMETEALVAVLERESSEVVAVVLSKLKVSKAAEVLGALPGKIARRITYAISLTGNVSPEVVHRIGVSIAEQLDAQPELAFADGPVERVGAILNFSPSATREDILEALDKTDAGFAGLVRKAIFTFANIPERIDPRDIPKITREVEPAKLVTALAAATEGPEAEAAQFILGNMSQRMAGQLREEMQAVGKISERDGDAAMTAVVAAIRALEASEDIFLVAEDE